MVKPNKSQVTNGRKRKMSKLQLEDLKRYFFEIKAYRKAINGAFVCPKIVLAFDKLFLKYERSALPLTKTQLKKVHEELDKLRTYLQDFERFRKLCLTFFDKYDGSSIPEDFATSHQIIKKQASNIFNDFKMGMYFHEGINTALSRLAESMRWFDVELSAVEQPTVQAVPPPEKAIITSANTDTIINTNDLTQNDNHQETTLAAPESNNVINGKAHLAPATNLSKSDRVEEEVNKDIANNLKAEVEDQGVAAQEEEMVEETITFPRVELTSEVTEEPKTAIVEATIDDAKLELVEEIEEVATNDFPNETVAEEGVIEEETLPINVAALYADLEQPINGVEMVEQEAEKVVEEADQEPLEESVEAIQEALEPEPASNEELIDQDVEAEGAINEDFVKSGAIVREMYENQVADNPLELVEADDNELVEEASTVRITESPTLPFPNPITPEPISNLIEEEVKTETNEAEGNAEATKVIVEDVMPVVEQEKAYIAPPNPIESAANLTKIPDLPAKTPNVPHVAPISAINRPKPTNFISYNVPLLSSDYVSHFFQQNPSMTSDLNRNHLEQIRQAFHRMKGEEIKAYIDGREYPYTTVLNQLQQALLSMEEAPIKESLKGLKQRVQPFIINTPINYQTLHDKVIHIQGTAEPNSIVCLNINYQSELQQRVDANGQFEFKHVELNFGKNTIIGHNKDFLFLDNFRYYLHLDLERNYRFMGRIDPMTQKGFQADEVDMIWRCQTCRNFMYSYSVSENHGYCTYPNCSSRNFEQQSDTGFWTE